LARHHDIEQNKSVHQRKLVSTRNPPQQLSTRQMSQTDTEINGHSNRAVRYRVHTKCVTPVALLKMLEVAVGKDNYRVEMRHNVYNITIVADVDKVGNLPDYFGHSF
jgi:hypothetical protein